MTVLILDYGAGNLTSVVRGIRAADATGTTTPHVVTSSASAMEMVAETDALVIPGVGHFDATRRIDAGWRAVIDDAIRRERPLLGICLGMQWLFEGSDEAPDVPGLGHFPGRCFHLREGRGPRGSNVRVPHVGWNSLDQTGAPSTLLMGVAPEATVYFTHSYACPIVDGTTATTSHGVAFASVVERGRVFGTQFHPEKSGATGRRVLANFLALARAARATRQESSC